MTKAICHVPFQNTSGGSRDDDTSLSSLLHDFLALGCSSTRRPDDVDLDDGGDAASSPAESSSEGVTLDAMAMAEKARKVAKRITALLAKDAVEDAFQVQLAGDVAKVTEQLSSSLRCSSRPAFQRALASRLRDAGYDAAICQTRWRHKRDVSAGSYEYIDVTTTTTAVVTGKRTTAPAPGERYIVDVCFAAEFVVARPIGAYAIVFEALPRILVARPEVVRELVKLASKAARRSLKSQGLTVPPWRKKRFMAAKWLGPHSRVPDMASEPRAATVIQAGDVECRALGFVLGSQVQPWLSYCPS